MLLDNVDLPHNEINEQDDASKRPSESVANNVSSLLNALSTYNTLTYSETLQSATKKILI
jgi:uncharacterized protein with gpF-like domain